MSKQYKRKSSQKSSGGKKALMTIGIIALLVILFMLSFWITSFVLKVNQQPTLPDAASPTPKPTYEQLEQMVIEKEEEIQKLQDELDRYRRNGSSSSSSSFSSSSSKSTTSSKSTAQPAATAKATAAPTAQPTKAPTPAPTQAPTVAPAQTAAPTQAAAEQPADTGNTAEAE